MGERSWRLVVDDACDGVRNMSVDRAIQISCARKEAPPTLRLYQWRPPAVSLGRFQSADGVDLEACTSLGIDVVRRFTGGRGVLHDDEVTYCVVAGTGDGVPRGVAASYRYLCRGLVASYGALGVAAHVTSRPRGERGSSACYLHATHADLSAGGLKLSGSAQVWHEGVVMQHGSVIRSRDIEREARVFGLESGQKLHLQAAATALGELLEEVPPVPRIQEALVEGFARELEVEFELGALSAQEQDLARELESQVGCE